MDFLNTIPSFLETLSISWSEVPRDFPSNSYFSIILKWTKMFAKLFTFPRPNTFHCNWSFYLIDVIEWDFLSIYLWLFSGFIKITFHRLNFDEAGLNFKSKGDETFWLGVWWTRREYVWVHFIMPGGNRNWSENNLLYARRTF